MHIEHIFTNFIATDDLNIDNDAIVKLCYEKQKTSGTSIYFTGAEPEVSQLFRELTVRLNGLHKHLGLVDNAYQNIYMAWANINSNQYIGIPHNHGERPNTLLSGVYYPKAQEGCSVIEFMTPNNAHHHVLYQSMVREQNGFTQSVVSIQPKTGSLLIFPSWLMHYVVPSDSKDDRISLAFNAEVKYK
jgi:uncharacterized protein (TIGR02466 family)